MSEPRVDLRIPSELYEKIESIAIATNQPFTPKSKNTDNPKPVLTPVIIKLIQLGLSQIDENELESLESDNKELTLKPSTNVDTEEIEKKILSTLLEKLEGIVSDKINLTIEDKLEKLIESKLNQINTNQNNLTNDEGFIESEVNQINSNLDNAKINEDKIESKSDNISQIELPLDEKENQSDSISVNRESNFTFADTINEIKRLFSQGLNYSQIAKKLTEVNYPTKSGKFNWTGTQVKRILEKK